MTYYITNTYTNRELVYASQNRKRAIMQAKERAITEKQSQTIYGKEGETIHYIGIAEFPYYLRELKLDPRDIKINYFE